MGEFVKAVSQMIEDHWVKFVTATAFAAVGWLIAWWRADRNWRKREFFNRINFSLNTIHNGTLLIRTLSEKSCSEVFLNDVAVERLTKIAQKTTEANPILPISKDDAWYYLNSVLNEMSEQFSVGLLKRDMGESVTSHSYLICLTNECDGAVRTRKIRVMVIRKDVLEGLPDEPVNLERPYHGIRWRTLKHMQTAWKSDPWNFLELELSV